MQGANASTLYTLTAQDLAIDDEGNASSLPYCNSIRSIQQRCGHGCAASSNHSNVVVTHSTSTTEIVERSNIVGNRQVDSAQHYVGAAIPLATVVDPQTGDRNPSLEMNYKASNGYSREMEHWITGSVLGASTDGNDFAQFNYRSEVCLVTRGANRHALITA